MRELTTEDAYQYGISTGEWIERQHIIALLDNYFDLTRFSIDVEGAEDNKDWALGFQAAIALIKENK